MDPVAPPKTLTIYSLVRQCGMNFSYGPSSGSPSIGCGFYTSLREAEHNRTIEVLKETSGSITQYHIFELTVPNPAYKE